MYIIIVYGGEYAADPDEAIGPFDTLEQAEKFAWEKLGDLNSDGFTIIGLSSPNGYVQ
jgi:hypothetical protein